MLESKDVTVRKLNAETHRFAGEVQLEQYRHFLTNYNKDLCKLRDRSTNKLQVRLKPILLQSSQTESASVLSLVHSDNNFLSKVLASLSSLCSEITTLVKEASDYYPTLVFYGEDRNQNPFESISYLIDLLQQLNSLIERSYQVIELLFRQINAALNEDLFRTRSGLYFSDVFNSLSELLVCFVVFDSLLTLPTIESRWLLYSRHVKNIQHNPSKFDLTSEQVTTLDRQISFLQQSLLTGNIFKGALQICSDKKFIMNIKTVNFHEEIFSYINQLITELEKDESNIFFTHIWMQSNALVVLVHYLFGNVDKKLLKRLIEVNKRLSTCTLSGNVLWYPEHFLLKHMPLISKITDVKSFETARVAKITSRSQSLPKTAHYFTLQTCLWLIDLHKIAQKKMGSFVLKELQDISHLLIEGVALIKRISDALKWITNLHADKDRPMTKSVLVALCRLVETLKSFQFMFQQKLLPIVYLILLISQQLSHKAVTLLRTIRKSVTQEKFYKEHQLDILSALSVCEGNLKGTITRQRMFVAKLSLSTSGLPNEQLVEIRGVIDRLELICCQQSVLNQLCNCSFLYWHQVYMLPVYFSKIVGNKADLYRYHLMVNALDDSTRMIGEKVSSIADSCYIDNMFGPLNQTVETNLRLQTHLHLQLPPSNPFKETHQLDFTRLKPMVLHKYYINVKKDTEHYLSGMFYNLTTVLLHDWKTYGEMRRLAYLQYNLDTVEDDLPMQTLEQGLDVLEIMRNIDVFVGKYLYNLNNQVFIEEYSNNKHLNTINISHIANSIRTHGIGIMNTTVNYTYQFLQKKFKIFSQFIFDEHIKSRLLKDIRFFSEHKIELNQMYPYERADKFNVGIKNLGLNQAGLSYLDLFRRLITQIGNAMGYIRLIRSGCRRFLADGTCFVPNLKETEKIHNLIREETCELTKKAMLRLESGLQNLIDNFEDATEYFKLLVKVFITVFRNSSNNHLKNFYMIVPALTINFVEHSLTSKEILNKKTKNNAAFTDDGFVIGLAYIIELLGQESQLNSLHWFHSVQEKFLLEKKKIKEQMAVASKLDTKLQQTLQLSDKRVNAFKREFQLLFYNFSSARIFFQT